MPGQRPPGLRRGPGPGPRLPGDLRAPGRWTRARPVRAGPPSGSRSFTARPLAARFFLGPPPRLSRTTCPCSSWGTATCATTARQLSCGQDIAADGRLFPGHARPFRPRAGRRSGPGMYPRLFWETGMIGQMLYLEAEAAGIRGTGIGCFFDDEVHRRWASRITPGRACTTSRSAAPSTTIACRRRRPTRINRSKSC